MGDSTYDGIKSTDATISGGSLVLTGSATSYMEIPSSALSGLSSITLEMWVTTSPSPTNTNFIWDKIFVFGDTNGAQFLVSKNENNGGMQVQSYSGSYDVESTVSSPAFDGLVNAHIVAIFVSGTSKQLYVNNVASTSGTCNVISTVNKFYLGMNLAGNDCMQGAIHEFRIYNGVLTTSQISANYAAGPSDLSMIHQYTFNDGTAKDSVGGASYLGTVGAGASISGGSLVLTGSATSYMEIPSSALSGLSTMTFEMWVTTTSPSSGTTWDKLFLFAETTTQKKFYIQKYVTANGVIQLGAYKGSTINDYEAGCSSSTQFDGLVNAHIVAIYVGGISKRMYVNNVATTSDSCIAIPTVNKILLGIDIDFSSGMRGSITEFRIYNGTLNPAQISANYAAGFLTPAPTMSPTSSPSSSIPSSSIPSSSIPSSSIPSSTIPSSSLPTSVPSSSRPSSSRPSPRPTPQPTRGMYKHLLLCLGCCVLCDLCCVYSNTYEHVVFFIFV